MRTLFWRSSIQRFCSVALLILTIQANSGLSVGYTDGPDRVLGTENNRPAPVVESSGKVRCLPPKSKKCQPEAKTPQQKVRRTLNRNGMGWAWPIAEGIIYCESRWDPYQAPVDSNGYRARGLWQINDQFHYANWAKYGWDWTDPVDNTLHALKIYHDAGDSWSPWSCSRY